MIKRFFKWTAKIILGLILLIALAYGGFHLIEYATGGKYVEYLSANSETIGTEEAFTFDLMSADIENSKLILAGEIHGFKTPQQFDLNFFKYLHRDHGVRTYVAELDFVQAELMNRYMKSGSEEELYRILENWTVVQGRRNMDYYDKYRKLQVYYDSLPSEERFQFIGIDQIQDETLFAEFVNDLVPDSLLSEVSTISDTTLSGKINWLETAFANSADTLAMLAHIQANLDYGKIGREEILFQNFHALYQQHNLGEEKVYGYFGLFHVFQYRVNGNHPLASKIRESDLGLEGNILSINFMMNESYMVMPSNGLPEFMRTGPVNSKMPISADNMLFMYIYGVKDFKRMTPENSKSLIKLDGEGSPYENSSRMNTTIQILPVADKMEMTDEGKPYVQYTVFVRNSDWAEPMEE
ncbi:hypothetical protein O3Q51_09575 [Cryomorphaceae bacterium 1068]|nr:hypothetical protein [Cryomorphaceae bacterium 1068]